MSLVVAWRGLRHDHSPVALLRGRSLARARCGRRAPTTGRRPRPASAVFPLGRDGGAHRRARTRQGRPADHGSEERGLHDPRGRRAADDCAFLPADPRCGSAASRPARAPRRPAVRPFAAEPARLPDRPGNRGPRESAETSRDPQCPDPLRPRLPASTGPGRAARLQQGNRLHVGPREDGAAARDVQAFRGGRQGGPGATRQPGGCRRRLGVRGARGTRHVAVASDRTRLRGVRQSQGRTAPGRGGQPLLRHRVPALHGRREAPDLRDRDRANPRMGSGEVPHVTGERCARRARHDSDRRAGDRHEHPARRGSSAGRGQAAAWRPAGGGPRADSCRSEAGVAHEGKRSSSTR
jgi:hypothetical protein